MRRRSAISAGRHATRAGARGSALPTRRLQLERPRLLDKVLPERTMLGLLEEHEAGPLVDPACGDEHVVRPEHQSRVAGAARERDALVDQPRSQTVAARPGL